MSGQSRWWAIPGALLVMTGVLALGNKDKPSLPAEATSEPGVVGEPRPAVVDEDGPAVEPAMVMARDASGRRQPLLLATPAEALTLALPQHFAEKRIEVTLWRRIDNQRELEPWINMRPVVRADATLPMAGIVPGRYDIEVGMDEQCHLLVTNVTAPGEVSFVAATPVR